MSQSLTEKKIYEAKNLIENLNCDQADGLLENFYSKGNKYLGYCQPSEEGNLHVLFRGTSFTLPSEEISNPMVKEWIRTY